MTSQHPHQDLFFNIWTCLLRQKGYKQSYDDNMKQLEELLGFSCFEQDFLQVSFEKIDKLIQQGVDVNLPFPSVYEDNESALYQTLIESHYRNCDGASQVSIQYITELFYFLVERSNPNKDLILNYVYQKHQDYKMLEELLKQYVDRRDERNENDENDKNDNKEQIHLRSYNVDTDYLEILLGFSFLDLDIKFNYYHYNYDILPIESLLIEYILLSHSYDDVLDLDTIDMFDIFNNNERQVQAKNNIPLMKIYSPQPSFQNILIILREVLPYINIYEIEQEIEKTFEYFGFNKFNF